MDLGLIYPYWKMRPPSSRLTTSMDIVASRHAKEMGAYGNVHIYLRGSGHFPKTVTVDRVQCHYTSRVADRLIGRLDRWRRLAFHRASSELAELRTAQYAAQAAIHLRRQRADLIQIYIFDAYLPIVRRFNPDARILLSIHDHRQITRDPNLVSHNLKHADLIVGCSEFMARQLAEHLPQFADRCIAIPNAVDLDRFESTAAEAPRCDGAVNVLYVGRISPEKGVQHLVQAFALMSKRFPESRLWLVGPASVPHQRITDPSDSDPLFAGLGQFWGKGDAFFKTLQSSIPSDIRAQIEFVGELDHGGVAQLMRQADILVFPSIWHEPFGLPVIEAMASAVPVIATRAGAFEETVFDGETGLLVERGDVRAMADAMGRLAGDPALRRSMGREGRARAEMEYSWDRNTSAWRRAYGIP